VTKRESRWRRLTLADRDCRLLVRPACVAVLRE
jgi:hypothetical protein